MGRENVIIKRVKFTGDDLGPRRTVDMHNGWDAGAPRLTHLARDRHKAAGIAIDVRYFENFCGVLCGDDRGKGHEFGSVKTLIELFVRFSILRAGENRTRAQRAWAIFHAAGIDGANFTHCDSARRFFSRQSSLYLPDARRSA